MRKKTLLLFLLIAIITFFLYHVSLPINLSKWPFLVSKNIISYIGLENVYDSNIRNGISIVLNSLTIIISLLSAIYVFTYREQKSVSPSASTDNRKNKLVIAVICLMIFNIVFGYLIVREFNGFMSLREYSPSLEVTKQLYSRILFLGLSLLILIHFIIIFIKYLFRTMSVDNMLVDSVKHSSRILESLVYIDRSERFRDFLNDKYRKFHFSLESVFQNLQFAAENNMNKEFEENIEDFKDVFDKLKKRYKDDVHVSTYLLNHESEIFIHSYHSAIRSNLSLIGNLLRNQQYNKAKKAVSLYFNLYINSDDLLIKIFKISLNDFLDIIGTEDEKQLLIFLDGLKEIPESQTLIAYKFLLMKLVNKNQIKNITNVVYDFKVKEKYKTSLLVILLQNLIKSIEISNYQITGFLVKFLITNHSGYEINRGLMILKKNNNAFTTVLEAEENIKGISENDVYAIKINDETFDYCYKKAVILLYGQHVYSIYNSLWYVKKWSENGNEIKLYKEFNDCDYPEYIISKIQAASSNYGLLFFHDSDVLKRVYNEINLTYPSLIKEEELSLPNTISLLINKLFKI